MEAFVSGDQLEPDWIFYKFDQYLPPAAWEEEDENNIDNNSLESETKIENNEGSYNYKEQMMMKKEKGTFLRLNYEAVIAAWDNQASPWTTGIPPELNADHFGPDFKVINY